MRGSNFAEISAFLAVAEEASFTRAAKRLGVSVATLSQSVRALEERLGVRLLNRTTRTVAPTEAGLHKMRELRPLLDGLDGVVDSINAWRDRAAGHLRLCVPPPVAHFLLAPLFAAFRAQHPDITAEIVVGSPLPDIVAERFDAGVDGKRFVARRGPGEIVVLTTPARSLPARNHPDGKPAKPGGRAAATQPARSCGSGHGVPT